MKNILIICLSTFYFNNLALSQALMTPLKAEAIRLIEQREKELVKYSDSIWLLAENSFEEVQSAHLLKLILRKEGFEIEDNAGGLPTQFVASYGKEKPTIAFFGEYDADPHASNKTLPYREELVPNANGHGGGHNLLGVGSLGSVLALKALIAEGKLKGSIKYFGTTAEGSAGGKVYLARQGYFKGLDLSLYWHPSPVTAAQIDGWDAMIEFEVKFCREKHHAFRESKENKVLKMSELFVSKLASIRNKGIGLNYFVAYTHQDIRYFPDTISFKVRLQHAQQVKICDSFRELHTFLDSLAHAEQVAIRTKVSKQIHEFVGNLPATQLVYDNMLLLGSIAYDSTEREYAYAMQKFVNNPLADMNSQVLPLKNSRKNEGLHGKASDIGEASWFAPEAYFVVCSIPPLPMHTWQTTAFTAYSIAHKGMIYAAKIQAMVAIDYFESQSLQTKIKKVFEEDTQNYQYKSLIDSNLINFKDAKKIN